MTGGRATAGNVPPGTKLARTYAHSHGLVTPSLFAICYLSTAQRLRINDISTTTTTTLCSDNALFVVAMVISPLDILTLCLTAQFKIIDQKILWNWHGKQ